MQWIRQNDISYVINKTIVTCARSNIDGSRPRKRYNPQLHQTQEVQSCKSTYCFECKWVKGPAVHELPPSLHCTTTRSLHRSSTCLRSNTYRWYKRRICSCVNLLYGNETVGRLKFGYKSKWEGISTSFKRSHHLWPPKGAHGGSVLPKLTVGAHKTLILCINMSNKCIK
jgi:hypothetical protein